MTGYDQLATLLGEHENLSMFRRFGPLNAKILLYMQAELLHLDEHLKDFVKFDLESGDPRGRLSTVYWQALDDAPDDGDEVGAWQKAKVSTIKTKLKEYYEFLIVTSKINSLSKPESCDYRYLSTWLRRSVGGNGFLKGNESDAWRPQFESDLILPSQKPRDHLAHFVSDQIIPVYHRFIGQRWHARMSGEDTPDTWEYKHKWFVVLVDVICMLLSSVVPTVSIFVLYFQDSTIARLGVITAMSFMFSLIMTFVVQGRRVDVFAATTAFAAVQVVFLGGQNCQIGISGA